MRKCYHERYLDGLGKGCGSIIFCVSKLTLYLLVSTADNFCKQIGPRSGPARDQARGRLGQNSRPRGRNFALNGTQGEVGASLKKNFFFFF